MKVSELGEFGLIDVLAGMVDQSRRDGLPSWQDLIIGIGDDCAAWRARPGEVQLGKIDALFEHVHFTLGTATWRELGWKALAINLSDIAAMGGLPRYAFVNLALPETTEVEHVKDLYRGMIELAEKFGVAIAGGNISRAREVSIVVAVSGVGQEERLMTRAAARPGDQIAVTGAVGGAAGGLRMLMQRLDFDAAATDALRTAFLTPWPRIIEGRVLVEAGVRCAIDISDGLVADLRHICEMSRVGARLDVDAVPVPPAVRTGFPNDWREMGLEGGEDYELLFAAPPDIMDRVNQALTCPVTVIGEITAEGPGEVRPVTRQGKPFRLAATGWDHFKKSNTKGS